MKIKVAIANHGGDQLAYLQKVVGALKAIEAHSIDISIYSDVEIGMPHILVNENIGKALPFACRKDMVNDVDRYDLFIYDENDMLITGDNIEAFLEYSTTLPMGEVAGFIRYELVNEAKKMLLDPNPFWGNLISGKHNTKFEIANRHQGCWVLLQKDLKSAIASGGFVFHAHDNPYGPLEQGASDPYTQCGLKKVFPRNYILCERLLIHHLPNKYVKYPEWINHGITLEQLFNNYEL